MQSSIINTFYIVVHLIIIFDFKFYDDSRINHGMICVVECSRTTGRKFNSGTITSESNIQSQGGKQQDQGSDNDVLEGEESDNDASSSEETVMNDVICTDDQINLIYLIIKFSAK